MNLHDIKIKIKRTKRIKTLSIKVFQENVVLNVPLFLSKKDVDDIIKKKEQWIKTKLFYLNSKPKYIKKKFITGENWMVLGNNYALTIKPSKKTSVILSENNLLLLKRDNRESSKLILENWFKKESIKIFEDTVAKYKETIGVSPKSIGIRKFANRWGSCNTKGDIVFNWLLYMAPKPIIEYVVVHELCHLIHHNHSKRYWALVKKIFPEYKKMSEWLKYNSNILNCFT